MFVLHFHTENGATSTEYIVLTDDDLNVSQYKDEYGEDGYELDIYDLSDGSGWTQWPAQLPTGRPLNASVN